MGDLKSVSLWIVWKQGKLGIFCGIDVAHNMIFENDTSKNEGPNIQN